MHSDRTVRTQRSATAFALGAARDSAGCSPLRPATPRRSPDRTWRRGHVSRYLTATPASRRSAVTLRAHWVTQSRVGLVVMPARKTRRVP